MKQTVLQAFFSRISNMSLFNFKLLRTKVTIMGILSICAALFIGALEIISLQHNEQNCNMESHINNIRLLQYQNQTSEAMYQHYIDKSYLSDILHNFSDMKKEIRSLKKISYPPYQTYLDNMLTEINHSITNYKELLNYHECRGYTTDTGSYSLYPPIFSKLSKSMEKVVDGSEWIEIKWIDSVLSEPDFKAGKKQYIHKYYRRKLPECTRRTNVIFRTGGTFTYHNGFYITDVSLTNGKQMVPVNLESSEPVAWGDGLASIQVTTFNGKPAIYVSCNFNAENAAWEETAVQVSIQDYSPEQYDTLSYHLYMEPSDHSFSFKYGGALSGTYGFSDNAERLDNMIHTYNSLVIEGKSTEQIMNEITWLVDDMKVNVPLYSNTETKINASLNALEELFDLFLTLREYDISVYELKAGNKTHFENATSLCNSINALAQKNSQKMQTASLLITVTIIILAALFLIIMTIRLTKRIKQSTLEFDSSLQDIKSGNIYTRIDVSKHDEFSQFGKSLNRFLDTTARSLERIQQVCVMLSDLGSQLEEQASSTCLVTQEISNELTASQKSVSGEIQNTHELTSDSMNALNESTQSLAQGASELKELSGQLENELMFYLTSKKQER